MAWPAIICYIPILLDMEEQIEMFASLSSFIKSQTSSTHQIIPDTWFSPVSYLLIISLETDNSPVWKGMQ